MEKLAALAPMFAAGFAIQQLMETIDFLVNGLVRITDWKKETFVFLISSSVGWAIAYFADLNILKALSEATADVPCDSFITGLVIGAGTEGVNSILKLLGYKKDEVKSAAATAAAKVP
jgi:hypothetical protein